MTSELHSDARNQQLWERVSGEGPKEFADFQESLRQGPARTYVATARARRKAYSLIRRYARRFDWRERARAWDNFQNRDEEEERRTARRAFLQRQEEEAWKLWRLGLALVYRFVHRDAATGEWSVDAKLAPKDALALLKFVSDLLAQIRRSPGASEEDAGPLEISWSAPDGGTSDQGKLTISHPGLRQVLGLVAPADDQQSPAHQGPKP